MQTFEVKDGKVTPDTRPDLANAFTNLKDGEYIVSILEYNTAFAQIEVISEWFANLPPDFNDAYSLQMKMNNFAYYLLRYTTISGAAGFDEAKKESAYESKYALLKKKYRDDGLNASAAVANAAHDCRGLYLEYTSAKAYKDLIDIQIRTAQLVFNAMQMHISLLKKEKNFTEQTGHSFPT